MANTRSERVLVTPSSYAKTHYLYVQEAGSLQSLEPHISSRKNLNSYLFFVVLSGHGTLTYEHQTKSLKSGDCAFLDCRSPYAHESSEEEPWRLTWVHFNGADAAHFYESYLEQGHPFFFRPVSILPFVETISQLYEISRDRTFMNELNAHCLLTELIAQIYSQQNEQTDTVPAKLQQIHEYIRLHYAEKITLDFLSELFFISKYHMSREYRQAYGMTLVSDITQRRIAHAKSALRFSELPVESVAEESGFLDSAYFIHVFKRAEGMTPLQYRKKWKSL
ncbi:MAG: AraC family transcriptional regulator [Lachnospiraceae bacterium]|nr:AraC family transcriptional regulator [Lachnospiraceae bacterium]